MVKQVIKKVLIKLGEQMVPPPSARVVVLGYHSIHPTEPFADATPDLFKQQLLWLKENCRLVLFSQVLNFARSSERDRPIVSITFDDGYADNYRYAFPLLQNFGIPAMFFVTVGLLEKDPEVVRRFQKRHGDITHGDIIPLEWGQVMEMLDAGMEFGAHTYSPSKSSKVEPKGGGKGTEAIQTNHGRAYR